MLKLVLLVLLIVCNTYAFQCPYHTHARATIRLSQSSEPYNEMENEESMMNNKRRTIINNIIMVGSLLGVSTNPNPVNALVEGNVPPSKTKTLGEEYRQGTAALGDSVEAEVLPREAYNKLDSGVIYADISKGSGETVKAGSKVNLQWVLRRSNGYFVDSSAVSDCKFYSKYNVLCTSYAQNNVLHIFCFL